MSHPDDKIFESFIPDYKPVGTLRCTVEGDELIIRISAKSLASAATYLENGGTDEMRYFKIADPALLLRDVARELCRDENGGGSMIEQMFDSAIVTADENGSLAFLDRSDTEGERDGIHPDR